MPKVTITKSRSGLPTSSGTGSLGTIADNEFAGVGAGFAGDSFNAFAAEQKQEAKLAEDSTYVATTGIMAQKNAQDIVKSKQQQFVDNPKGYADAVFKETSTQFQSLLQRAPSKEARRALESQLGGISRNTLAGAQAWERESTVTTYINSHEDSLNLIENGLLDNPASLDVSLAQHSELLEASKTYLADDPSRLADLERNGQKRIYSSFLQGSIEKNPAAAKAFLDSGEVNNLFDANEVQTFERMIQSKQAANYAAADKAVIAQNNAVKGNIKLGIHKAGSLDDLVALEQQVDEGFESGLFKDVDEYIKYDKLVEARRDAITEGQGAITLVDSILNQGGALDPTDTDNKNAVAEHYAQVQLPLLQNLPPEQVLPKQLEYIDRVGIVPSQIISNVNASLFNGAPQAQVEAADLVTSIINNDPRFLDQFDKDTANYAKKINTLRSSGLNNEEAVKAATTQHFEKNTAPYKARVESFNGNKTRGVEGVRKNFDDDVLDTLFSKEVPATPGMRAEWENLYETFYIDEQMSEEDAREMAYKNLEARWGKTDVVGSGKTWMKYSPEKAYGVKGVSNKWIKDDLNKTLIDNGTTKNGIDNREFSQRLRLAVDPRSSNSKKPSYLLEYKTDNGLFAYVMDGRGNGQPLRWAPDFKQSDIAKRAERARKEKIEELKKLSPKKRALRAKTEAIQRGRVQYAAPASLVATTRKK